MEWMIGSVIMWLLMLVLMIVWIILPFAVFGINKRLDRVNRKLDEMTKLLDKQNTESGTNPKINQDF